MSTTQATSGGSPSTQNVTIPLKTTLASLFETSTSPGLRRNRVKLPSVAIRNEGSGSTVRPWPEDEDPKLLDGTSQDDADRIKQLMKDCRFDIQSCSIAEGTDGDGNHYELHAIGGQTETHPPVDRTSGPVVLLFKEDTKGEWAVADLSKVVTDQQHGELRGSRSATLTDITNQEVHAVPRHSHWTTSVHHLNPTDGFKSHPEVNTVLYTGFPRKGDWPGAATTDNGADITWWERVEIKGNHNENDE